MTMKVRVLFFSVLRDITGAAELEWTCPPASSLAVLLEELYTRWPKLRAWDTSLLLAIDCAYVKRNTPLHEGCEVALMPPVQGG
ncbi:MAG: MoaD/ThiS family protein [Verrucomicrobiota bacterium]